MSVKKEHFFWIAIVCLIFSAVLAIKSGLFELLKESPPDGIIQSYLEKKLRLSSSAFLQYQFPKKRQVIYVMGGNEESLRVRFKKASELFHAGLANKIWVYRQAGITNFNYALGRNLTNKEWAKRQFALLGIASEYVDFINVKEGFWGTLSESRTVPKLAGQQGYPHILVVTSAYHTKRVWLTFSTYSEENNVSLTVYAANDVSRFWSLFMEYCKLLVYRYILLPLS